MQPTKTRVIYLHGFASGPASKKATYLCSRLAQAGYDVSIPDLNRPSFRSLTLTSQLKIIDEVLLQTKKDVSDTVLIGSSMGGLLAVLKASQPVDLRALILMAPGFGLSRRWHELLGEGELEKWKEQGHIDVFHYALNETTALSYDFIEDADRYQTDGLKVSVPTLVFHGRHDETIPISESIRFRVQNREFVQLRELDDNHDLIDSLEHIWSATEDFLKG